ncbi:MAG: ribonuclease III [Verrucomicrobia bacterium]|nr:ribonuclease III [Verrucomicrobiota bacterium]
MSDSIHAFEQRIAYAFANPDLLEQALTHASLDTPAGDNQRLEFLGDAILDLVVAERLYREYPELDEGGLDRLRAALVNGKTLAALAHEIGLAGVLRVSEAQHQHHPDPSKAMLEDALEALLGAVYLDGGLEAARTVVHHIFEKAFQASDPEQSRNPKSQLQEWTQAQHQGAIPEYHELPAEGPDHDRSYHAAVHFQDKEIGRGCGSSKKAAEHAAAQAALEALELN